jgi:hypothetical protein
MLRYITPGAGAFPRALGARYRLPLPRAGSTRAKGSDLGRRWGGALKAGSPALGAMSSVAGSGGGLGAQKQYSPCRNLWEEGSFLEPPSWGLGAAAITVPSQ